MPRGRSGGSTRRAAVQSLRLEQLHREVQAERMAARAVRAAQARREAVPGWDRLMRKINTLDIQEEIDALELRLLNDARLDLGLIPFESYPRDGAANPPQPADTRKPRDDYRNYLAR